MAKNPKDAEEKMLRVLTALRTLAPEKQYGGMTLAQYQAQVNKSLAPRTRLEEIKDEEREQLAERDNQDDITMSKVQLIVNGVLADPDEGEDSALYEAMGYVRKSARKSGLTRKKKETAK